MGNPLEALIKDLHLKQVVHAPVAATEAVAHVVAKEAPKFVSVMVHVEQNTTVALDEIQKYTPKAVAIANVVAPEFALLEDAAGVAVVGACGMLKNGILLIQQKYANAPKGPTTNAAKFADVMATFSPIAMSIMNQAGLHVDDTRAGKIVNSIVEILGANLVPVTP